MIPALLQISADSLNLYNTIISGIIVTIVTVAIERLVSYVKKDHDARVKTTFQVNNMSEDLASMKSELADNTKKINENVVIIKEFQKIVENMPKELLETKRGYRKLLNVLNKHESEIRMISKKGNVDLTAFAERDFSFDQEDSGI